MAFEPRTSGLVGRCFSPSSQRELWALWTSDDRPDDDDADDGDDDDDDGDGDDENDAGDNDNNQDVMITLPPALS